MKEKPIEEEWMYQMSEPLAKEVSDFLSKKPYGEAYPSWKLVKEKKVLDEDEMTKLLNKISSYPLDEVINLMAKIRRDIKPIKKPKKKTNNPTPKRSSSKVITKSEDSSDNSAKENNE